MKNNTFDVSLEKEINSFFAEESPLGNSQITLWETSSEIVSQAPAEEGAATAEKLKQIDGLFRKVFAFFPGTQILYLLGAFWTFASIYAPQNLPGIFSFWAFFWLFAGTFMTWAGLGDLKNKKHLFLPASSLATGTILGLFFGLAAKIFPGFQQFIWGDLPVFLLLFPLAFIVPILVKSLLDKEEQKHFYLAD